MMNSIKDFGGITISDNLIDPTSTPNAIRNALKSWLVSEEIVNGWLSMNFSGVSVDKHRFNSRMIFSPQGKLTFIVLTFLFENEVLKWENWRDDLERERDDEHSKFLEKLLGTPPYNYKWGVIEIGTDKMSGGTSITIRYT